MGDNLYIELDAKDKKILNELDYNARESHTQIAKNTGIAKHVVQYRINNLINKDFIKNFISFIDIQQLGYTFYDVFLKLKHLSNEQDKKIIDELKSVPEVGWFISTRGEWKIVVCVMAKNASHFNLVLKKILGIVRDRLIRYEFFIVLTGSQLPYKKVLGAKNETMPTHLGRTEEYKLKKNDFEVLQELAVDARISVSDIADKHYLSNAQVRYSIKTLERSGVIQAYKPLIDVSKAGYRWHIILLQLNYCSENEKKQFIEYLKNLEQVFYIVKGVGNWSLMVEFHTKEIDEFNQLQDTINAKYEKLISTESVMQVTKEHKCVFYPV